MRDLTQTVVAHVLEGFPGVLWLAMSRLVTQPVVRMAQAMTAVDPSRAKAVPEVPAEPTAAVTGAATQ